MNCCPYEIALALEMTPARRARKAERSLSCPQYSEYFETIQSARPSAAIREGGSPSIPCRCIVMWAINSFSNLVRPIITSLGRTMSNVKANSRQASVSAGLDGEPIPNVVPNITSWRNASGEPCLITLPAEFSTISCGCLLRPRKARLGRRFGMVSPSKVFATEMRIPITKMTHENHRLRGGACGEACREQFPNVACLILGRFVKE